MADNKFGVWDIKTQSWVRNKQYDSVSKANAASNRMDTTYGGSRYIPKLIPSQLPEKISFAEPDEQPVGAKRGGYIKSADGIASRGKTRGKLV